MDERYEQENRHKLESISGGVSMSFLIYTYSNPYEIDKEWYWNSIRNCPHFCVSQTMANGIMEIYHEIEPGKISTVQNLVKGLFSYWESMECKIKQYADIDAAIGKIELADNEEKIRQSLRFNRKDLSNSLRILFELDMDIQEMKLELMSEEQNYLIKIYEFIKKSDMSKDFLLKSSFTEAEIEDAIKKGMRFEKRHTELDSLDCSTIIVHGIHQFSPMILRTLELIAKYKSVILLFNYQNQYKNVYQTWIDIYSLFDLPITSQFLSEFKPNSLLATSYTGNLLADKMAKLIEGNFDRIEGQFPFEVIEFDNNTEFANYVAQEFEKGLREQEKDKNSRRSTLYYMKEQFYAANNSVNNILKVYYPGQFGERHFLTYPIGHFFLSITNIWNPDEGGIRIENMDDIIECLNSGLINVKSEHSLSSIFNRTQEFFFRVETIEQIVELLEKLKKRLLKSEKNPEEKVICQRLIYFDVTLKDIDDLIEALKQLERIAKLFYEDFENRENNFKEFYKKIRDFLENRVLEAEELEDSFRDVVKRVLIRLEEVDKIDASGTFDVLKETMSYYLKQENRKGLSADWIVRDFEQIDGDILKSRRQNQDTVYHFACLSDNDMNVTNHDKFPWPLDVNFFEVVQNPIDWKYQVYVKSRREYKNFKRYAFIYGLQFNRAKFKLSYVKNVDDKENELFYLLRILGANKTFPTDGRETNYSGNLSGKHFDIDFSNQYNQYDYFRYKICRYRFLLESTIQKGPVFRDHFLLLKYLEILLENAARVSLQGQIATEDVVFDTLSNEYRKLERKFEFVRDIHIERMDAITNAKNYLQHSILKKNSVFPKVTLKDLEYMKKREEFIYLSLDSLNFSNNFREVAEEEIKQKLSWDRLDIAGYSKMCGDWCRYCAVREICLEFYKYDKV